MKSNYPISSLTTLQIGGPAKKFVVIKTEDELIEAIQYAEGDNLDFLIIGGGSNLLVSDQGVDKLIIKNGITGISTSKVGFDSFEVKVKSGTLLQDLVNYAIQYGLSGLQKMTGIPGTVGGAVYGNAGAYGQTISDHLVEVTVLNSSAVIPANAGIQLKNLLKEDCGFAYRDSGFKRNHSTIIEVAFQLENGDPKTLQQQADEVLKKRLIKYPKGIKCPGSFFKNIVAETLSKDILDKIPPENIVYDKLPAGKLLEEVGAKGDSLDGIEIASYHANLFVNKGEGSAQAFYDLAKKYTQKVYEKFGITLEPEVQLINLPQL
ncbi:MAG: UDP-N-acetylmuramate dehydrogenase [Candidatus Daviesbacteria bacterium]|nr:UDP-N-acetylmuramate dehydrogenase [Candidatus Daviesbacteria bacterium]